MEPLQTASDKPKATRKKTLARTKRSPRSEKLIPSNFIVTESYIRSQADAFGTKTTKEKKPRKRSAKKFDAIITLPTDISEQVELAPVLSVFVQNESAKDSLEIFSQTEMSPSFMSESSYENQGGTAVQELSKTDVSVFTTEAPLVETTELSVEPIVTYFSLTEETMIEQPVQSQEPTIQKNFFIRILILLKRFFTEFAKPMPTYTQKKDE